MVVDGLYFEYRSDIELLRKTQVKRGATSKNGCKTTPYARRSVKRHWMRVRTSTKKGRIARCLQVEEAVAAVGKQGSPELMPSRKLRNGSWGDGGGVASAERRYRESNPFFDPHGQVDP